MTRPKQQHFVPRIYLQNFCTKENKHQIYFLDKQNGTSGKTNIVNVAQEKDFYVDISQQDKDSFEKYYSYNIEPTLGKLLERIVSVSVLGNENAPLLSYQDRKTLSYMIVHQMLRTRSARNLMREKRMRSLHVLLHYYYKSPN